MAMERAAAFGAISEAAFFWIISRNYRTRASAAKSLICSMSCCCCVCRRCWAVLGGAGTFVDIARFGEKKLGLLRRFWPFRDGTPAHDHFGDIFAALDAEKFQRCFVVWVAALTGAPADVIAIDGK